MHKKDPFFWLSILALLIVAYFSLFYRLGHLSIRDWDESRNAVNTLEMSLNGNPIVRYHHGKPDMWETKPPLLIWLQVASVKTFGYTEFALRLPSVMAALATMMLLVFFFHRYGGRYGIGILACLLLLTSEGYTGRHMVRLAEHEALLLLFESVFLLSWFLYLESGSRNKKYLLVAFTSFTLAILTKSIAPFMLLPAVFIYTILHKQLLLNLKDKNFLKGIFVICMLCGSYYLLREIYSPGYLARVWDNELFPRYLNKSIHERYFEEPFHFYWREMLMWQFQYYQLLLLPAALINLLHTDNFLRRLNHFMSLSYVIFYFIIARGTTNYWYAAPLLIIAAIIISIALNFCFEQTANAGKLHKPWLRAGLTSLLVIYLISGPMEKNFDRILHERSNDHVPELHYGYLMNKLHQEGHLPKQVYYFLSDHSSHSLYYYELYNKVHAYQMPLYKEGAPLKAGDQLICNFNQLDTYIGPFYEYKTLEKEMECYLIQITGRKTFN